jgi:hypothetical protein
VEIVVGSKSDMEALEKAARKLEDRGILHEVRVISAHRGPDIVADYACGAPIATSLDSLGCVGRARRCQVDPLLAADSAEPRTSDERTWVRRRPTSRRVAPDVRPPESRGSCMY